MSRVRTQIAVIGAGSWGTALARHFAQAGDHVQLWCRRPSHARQVQSARENTAYLPGVALPETLVATADFRAALEQAELIVSTVPVQHSRSIWVAARTHLKPGVPLLCASKGIEVDTLRLMSEVLAEILPDTPLAFLAGPSFAKEVAAHLPTAVVVGATDLVLAEQIQRHISNDRLRAYTTTDVVGLELGGALKNIIAIACGCADGLGFGHNSRAAIITRGLAEMTRLAVKLGADPRTLAGLGGMGDLVLTCTGSLSRNRRVGMALGTGQTLDQILSEIGQVAEGVATTQAAHRLALREDVEMPITHEVYRVLYEGKAPEEAVASLMGRELKLEQA